MLIDIVLKNKRTGTEKTQRVDDAVSPSTGYTQFYADKLGEDYAKCRAPETLNTRSYPNDEWEFVKAMYINIPKSLFQYRSYPTKGVPPCIS